MSSLSWRERVQVAVSALLRGQDYIGNQTIEALKASGGKVSSTQFVNYDKAKSPETRLEPLIKNGWRRNELIFACVSKKANTASQIRLMVVGKKDKTEIENHPLRKLIARPNRFMTEADFFASIVIMQDFAGAAYFEKVRSGSGRTVELWPIRPDWMKAYLGSDGMQQGWLYTPPGKTTHVFEMDDVLAFRTYDPLNEYFGYPPVAVAARVGDLDNSVTDYIRLVFEKGGVPPGILSSTQPITEAIADRIRAIWRDKYGGYANWDAPVVLGHDTKYQNTGLTFEQMGLQFLDERAEVRICMALKVPPTIINSKIGLERSVESNVKETQRNWWDNDLSPIYKSYADVVRNELLVLEYPDGLDLKWDFSDVPALQEDRDKTRQLALDALRSGGITRNQFFAEWGLPDLGPRGEVFLMSAMTIEMPVSKIKENDAATDQIVNDEDEEDSDDEDSGAGKGLSAPTDLKVKFPSEKAKEMRAVEKKIQVKLSSYLKGLKGRLVDSVRELTSHRDIKQDATQQSFWNGERQTLFELLFPLFKDSMTDEAKSAYDELAGIVDAGIAWDIVNDQALSWANTQTSLVVSQITKTSMNGFLTEFEPWVNSGEPLDVLIDSLSQYYDPVRAEMIAVTETTRAFAQANIGTWKQFESVTGYDVLTAEDDDVDDICLAEQARNPHALDEDPPPYHVRCRCGVRPVVKNAPSEFNIEPYVNALENEPEYADTTGYMRSVIERSEFIEKGFRENPLSAIRYMDHVLGNESERVGGSYDMLARVIELSTKSVNEVNIEWTWAVNYRNQQVVMGGLEAMLSHELGHHVKDVILSNSQVKIWDDFFVAMKKVDKKFWSKNLSWYAASDADEAFSEAFAVITHSSYVVGSLPEIEAVMRELIGLP